MSFRPEISSSSPYRVDVDAVRSSSIGGDTPSPLHGASSRPSDFDVGEISYAGKSYTVHLITAGDKTAPLPEISRYDWNTIFIPKILSILDATFKEQSFLKTVQAQKQAELAGMAGDSPGKTTLEEEIAALAEKISNSSDTLASALSTANLKNIFKKAVGTTDDKSHSPQTEEAVSEYDSNFSDLMSRLNTLRGTAPDLDEEEEIMDDGSTLDEEGLDLHSVERHEPLFHTAKASSSNIPDRSYFSADQAQAAMETALTILKSPAFKPHFSNPKQPTLKEISHLPTYSQFEEELKKLPEGTQTVIQTNGLQQKIYDAALYTYLDTVLKQVEASEIEKVKQQYLELLALRSLYSTKSLSEESIAMYKSIADARGIDVLSLLKHEKGKVPSATYSQIETIFKAETRTFHDRVIDEEVRRQMDVWAEEEAEVTKDKILSQLNLNPNPSRQELGDIMFYSCNRTPAYHLSGILLFPTEKVDLRTWYKDSIKQKIDEIGELPEDQARNLKGYLDRHSADIFKPIHHIEQLYSSEGSDAGDHSLHSDGRASNSFSEDSLDS
jgi:hypothetical protein